MEEYSVGAKYLLAGHKPSKTREARFERPHIMDTLLSSLLPAPSKFQTLAGLFELTWRLSRALNVILYIASGTTEVILLHHKQLTQALFLKTHIFINP